MLIASAGDRRAEEQHCWCVWRKSCLDECCPIEGTVRMCSAVIDRSRIGSGARPDDLMKPNQIRMKADRWHCLFTSTHCCHTVGARPLLGRATKHCRRYRHCCFHSEPDSSSSFVWCWQLKVQYWILFQKCVHLYKKEVNLPINCLEYSFS